VPLPKLYEDWIQRRQVVGYEFFPQSPERYLFAVGYELTIQIQASGLVDNSKPALFTKLYPTVT
jgi:hypothetical protein